MPMPKIEEYCEIVAVGQKYRYWDDVELSRGFGDPISQIRLSVAEISPQGSKDWSSIRLKPGDPVEAYLAGRKVVTGNVTVRQVAYDKNNHAVRFIVQSKPGDTVTGTVEAKPGQYRKSNLQQIARSVLAPFGIDFKITGAPDGANKIFDRVSVHPGEGVFELIERLSRFRNLHLTDDADGNLVATRRDSVETVGDLQEGRNILSAQLVWNDSAAAYQVKTLIDDHGSDPRWGDEVRGNSATATNPDYNRKKTIVLNAEHPGDTKDAQMRSNHEVDLIRAEMFSVSVTVRGWLRDDGSLWIEHVGKNVNVYSPMLFPQDKLTLAIQDVTHKQNDRQGTTTTLSLTLPTMMKAKEQVHTGAPSAPGAATPDGSDA